MGEMGEYKGVIVMFTSCSYMRWSDFETNLVYIRSRSHHACCLSSAALALYKIQGSFFVINWSDFIDLCSSMECPLSLCDHREESVTLHNLNTDKCVDNEVFTCAVAIDCNIIIMFSRHCNACARTSFLLWQLSPASSQNSFPYGMRT